MKSPIESIPEEILKAGREVDRKDKERAGLFEAMIKTPAWQEYIVMLNTMLETKSTELLTPAGSVDGAVALEYVKGTMCGLILARDLPSITVSQMLPANPAQEADDE